MTEQRTKATNRQITEEKPQTADTHMKTSRHKGNKNKHQDRLEILFQRLTKT